MSDVSFVPVVSGAKVLKARTNNFWWVVAIVAIVAVTVFAVVCTVRGGHFTGQLIVGSKSFFGTKVYIGCQ